MTVRRTHPLLVAAAVALAIVAGVWAGGADNPAPRAAGNDAPALRTLSAARVRAREALRSATTPAAQRLAAERLASLHRDAARTVERGRPELEATARAYAALATSGATSFTAAKQAVGDAEARLAASLRPPPAPGPRIPPVLPLVVLTTFMIGLLIASRSSKSAEPPPPPPFQPPKLPLPAWDTPPPGV